MSNLLAIETAILNNPIVKQGLQLAEVNKLRKAVVVSEKKTFSDTLKLGVIMGQGLEWFKSEDSQAIFNEEGVTWTTEEFAMKVFGYGKSFFHRVIKASKVDASIVENFLTKCDELESQGKSVHRGVDALIKFAKAVEENTTEGGEEGEGEGEAEVETREETLLTLAFKGKLVGQENNVSVRLNLSGECKSTNTKSEIELAIAMLQSAILNKFN